MSTGDKPSWMLDGVPGAASAPDRGQQFGDGLFETLAVRHGRISLLSRHLERLEAGCRRLGLPVPERTRLERELEHGRGGREFAILKLLLLVSGGGRGYARPARLSLHRHIACFPWPEKQPERLRIRLCELRLSRQPALAGIKHCNRLEQVLARREVDAAGADEGLLLDTEGQVVEGIASNLFIVRQGQLLTPSLDQAGVAGVMRAEIMALAQSLDIALQVTALGLDDILSAEEVFMSNSLIGICPVTALETEGKVHAWEAGELTWRLKEKLGERL